MPAGALYSAYVGVCVVFGARGDIHWVSDAVAANLMGLGIGWTIGSGFRRDRLAHEGKGSSAARDAGRLGVHPVLASGGGGLRAVVRLP